MLRILGIAVLMVAFAGAAIAETTGAPTLKFEPSLLDLIGFGISAGIGATATKIFYDRFWGEEDSSPSETTYQLRVMNPNGSGLYLHRDIDLPYRPQAGTGLILAEDPEIEAIVERTTRTLESDEDAQYLILSLLNARQYAELGKNSDWSP